MTEIIEKKPIAVKVSGVKKMYKLGQIGGGSLQADLQSWWARVRHKEDPNSKIGEGERSHGNTFMALNGIDLTIYQGEAVGIIGSNGAGKSTLLKLLSRVTAPTEGEIDIYGRIASMLEVGTGFNPEMTGRENVYLNGAILGMTKAEIDAKMEDIIEFSEVREFIDTPVKRYSSGMFVKLAFSVAAHLDAEIMIMDEVLAVGDVAFQSKCLERMKEAAKEEARTVLYVSHNMNTIRQLCDRCIVLEKGKVVYEGDVESSIKKYLHIGLEEDNAFSADLQRFAHLSENNNSAIKLKKISITDHEDITYINTDTLRLRIIFDAYEKIKGLGLRLSFSNSSLVPVATSYSDYLFFEKGENLEAIVDIKLKSLREDEYYISLGFFGINTVSLPYCNDFVENVLKIRIIKDPNLEQMFEWNTSHYGCVEIEQLKFSIVKNE